METFKINVNEQRKILWKPGPSKAEAIVRAREEQGEFRSINDLQQRLQINDEELGELKKVIEI